MDELEKYIRQQEKEFEKMNKNLEKNLRKYSARIRFLNDKCPQDMSQDKKILTTSLCDVIYDLWVSSIDYKLKKECFGMIEEIYPLVREYLYDFLENKRA